MANEVCVLPKEAARRLGIGIDRCYRLIDEGVIATVPHLSTPARRLIAVAEIERLAATGVSLAGQPGRPRKDSAA